MVPDKMTFAGAHAVWYKPNMLRTLVERLSRNRILKRRLPSTFGSTPIFVSPDSQLKYLKPGPQAFDLDLLRVAHAYIREQSIVWDIGANVGVFAFAAASIARKGSVLAVEPDIWLAQLIRKSAALAENLSLTVQVIPAAVSARNGIASLLIAKRGRASSCLESAGGRSQMGGVRDTVLVPTLTMDTLLDSGTAPTFVKIDVEGAEVQVLQSAKKLLSEVRPLLYIEVGEESATEATRLLQEAGYLLFDGVKPIARCCFNTMAIPQEKIGTTP